MDLPRTFLVSLFLEVPKSGRQSVGTIPIFRGHGPIRKRGIYLLPFLLLFKSYHPLIINAPYRIDSINTLCVVVVPRGGDLCRRSASLNYISVIPDNVIGVLTNTNVRLSGNIFCSGF